MFTNTYDATYTTDVAKLDYDACIEFMIMAMWEKAERDRLFEICIFGNSFDRFAYKWASPYENVGHIIITL